MGLNTTKTAAVIINMRERYGSRFFSSETNGKEKKRMKSRSICVQYNARIGVRKDGSRNFVPEKRILLPFHSHNEKSSEKGHHHLLLLLLRVGSGGESTTRMEWKSSFLSRSTITSREET